MTLETILLSVLIALVLAVAVLLLLNLRMLRRVTSDRAPDILTAGLTEIGFSQEKAGHEVRAELEHGRREIGDLGRSLREEIATHLTGIGERTAEGFRHHGDSIHGQARQWLDLQRGQHEDFGKRLEGIREAHGREAENLRLTVERQMSELRKENETKLEQMRGTVDEKLQGTLERRLGESFRLVGERLEAVHKGLGEMQSLASGVGDLKRVFTNVKARGVWGEVQLGALLEHMLSPEQFRRSALASETSGDRVEFAIVMPGHTRGEDVLLPIDCNFPIADYERLQSAADTNDSKAVEMASEALDERFREYAKDISEKFVHPPRTTDFAIMYLPAEGLFAEAIKRPGLASDLQRNYRVMIAGPTTLTSILSALQMGFRTLAIQEHSSEVWQILGAVKTEFGKFGNVLEGVKRKLAIASNDIDKVQVRHRAMDRALRGVEALPSAESDLLIGSELEGAVEAALEQDLVQVDDDVQPGRAAE